MTKDEAMRPFGKLSANWPFLRFEDALVFEMWFDALKRFKLEVVEEGVNRAIETLRTTPTVSEVLECVQTVREEQRRADQEFNANLAFQNSVKCTKCNDNGYLNVTYPMGYEYVRPCPCNAGLRMWGPGYFKKQDQLKDVPVPLRTVYMLFGGESEELAREEAKKYKEIRIMPKQPKGVIEIRYERRQ